VITYQDKIQKIYIELTERCNLNCPHCFRGNWTHTPADMGEDVLKNLVKTVKTAQTLVIGGIGEPTAHTEFSQYCMALNHDNMELTSNAYCWNEPTLHTVSQIFKKVTISVDGMPDSFMAARGFDFEVMAENVGRLAHIKKSRRSKFPLIHAQLVLSKDNAEDVKSLFPILRKIGFERLVISNLLPQTERDKDKIFYTPYLSKDLRDFVSSWYPISSRHQLPVKMPQTKFSAEHRCAFVENGALFITATGDVAPCFRFAHDGQEFVFGRKKIVRAVSFGNILEKSLDEIWQNKEYLIFRFQNFASRYPSCVDCDFVEFCDYITTSEADCRANEPSCADCLWCRGLIECP
jgi:tungsten cofactor oxidoreducase radical SAM maturase